MSQPDERLLRDASLGSDARFDEPLARVHHAPGMLLGIEATRSEQAYHRRRVTRHGYWLHGSGTVVGLRVSAKGDDPGNDTTRSKVRLLISPGIAVDGLGREVSVHEPYCLDLGTWLDQAAAEPARWSALLTEGRVDEHLWLKVTLRYQDRPSGLQPVMATEVNAGTDPVQPSRIQDGVLFEILPEHPSEAEETPFPSHAALQSYATLESRLGAREKARINAAAETSRLQLQMGARLLHALGDDNQALSATRLASLKAEDLARTLLARVAVRLGPGHTLLVNPRRVEVDNLARPFLFNPDILARLLRA